MKLSINHIQKTFDQKDVLKDVSYTFEKGKIYGLLGRNGAGKTTLFNIISKDLSQDDGTVQVLSENNIYCELKEQQVGYCYASPMLPEFLTGFEFIRFFIEIHNKQQPSDDEIMQYLSLMKIEIEDANRLMKDYSHGMKNKMQMLCFLISKPDIILLDEPLTSFDVVVALEIKELLRSMKEEHIIIFSTHILQLARDLCDEIIILHEGILSRLNNDMQNESLFEQEVLNMLQEVS